MAAERLVFKVSVQFPWWFRPALWVTGCVLRMACWLRLPISGGWLHSHTDGIVAFVVRHTEIKASLA